MTFENPPSRLEKRLARAFGVSRAHHPDVQDAVDAADAAEMEPVLASEAGALLLLDTYSGEHFLFKPTGAVGEYESREHVEDIVAGEPIPGRFLEETWSVLDPDWRMRVENGSVEQLAA